MCCNLEINLFIITIIDSKCKEINHVHLFNILKDIITLLNNIEKLHTAVITTYLFSLNTYSLIHLNQLLNRDLYIYIFSIIQKAQTQN